MKDCNGIVDVFLSSTHICLKFSNLIFKAKLIDSIFPDYKKIWLIMDDQGMTQDFYEDTFRGRIMKIPVCFDCIIVCKDWASIPGKGI